ncbi:transposable element Tcb2 transposase [Trichonephila clavipes]|nr:transposable element Tcb2 transposase [Trichonephila clavipes]
MRDRNETWHECTCRGDMEKQRDCALRIAGRGRLTSFSVDYKPGNQSLFEWLNYLQRNWTAVEWNQVVFSDKSRFHLSSDGNHVRVWRPRGERLNPVFALQRHTDPIGGVMVWGAIANNTRSPLVLIRCPITAQQYVHDILQPHVLLLMQRLPEALFQQDNTRPHMARVSQDFLCIVTTHPSPALSENSSRI